MDTNKLKYFVTIAECGSLTRASQILAISHSGLSKAVQSLEAETKIKLFRPQGRGLEITADGKWFYQKAQEILRITNEIAIGQKENHLSLRIGLSGVVAMTCAGIIAKNLNERLLLSEVEVGDIESSLIAGELDFGIAFIPSPKPELEYLKIGEVDFNSYLREDLLPKFKASSFSYAVPISEFPLNPLGYKNRDGWPNDLPRACRFAVSGFAIALDLLRAGQAAVYMPDFVATLENANSVEKPKIVLVKEHKGAHTKRKIFLVKRQSNEESKEMKIVAKIIRQICCSKN